MDIEKATTPPAPGHRFLAPQHNDCFPVALARFRPCALPAAQLPLLVNHIVNNWGTFK